MKPGGVLRIVVPDLDRYLRWNALKAVEKKMNRYSSLPEAISNLTQTTSMFQFGIMI
jgi:predicted SAM-dependent methyltransferase